MNSVASTEPPSAAGRRAQAQPMKFAMMPLLSILGSIPDGRIKRENRVEFTDAEGREDTPTSPGDPHFTPCGCNLVVARNEVADPCAVKCSHTSQVEDDRPFALTEQILNKNLDCLISRPYGHLARQTNHGHTFTNIVMADRHALG